MEPIRRKHVQDLKRKTSKRDHIMSFHVGDKVKWDWGNGTGTGEITERFESDVTRTIKGSEVSRNASKDEPAFLIKQDDGDKVLKSVTEIDHA